MLQCVILAGGEATRMFPLTQSVPKILLHAGGRPFLDHQLELLARQGIRDVVLAIGRHGALIREYAGSGERWGIRVRYSEDGDRLLGTGGALRAAAELGLLDESFFVLYGDSFTPISLENVLRAFRRQQRAALMVVMKNDDQWDTSNVLIEDNDLVVYDKTRAHIRSAEMRHIDYGVGVVTRAVVQQHIPAGKSDLAELYRGLSLRGELGWFSVEERFYEIGSMTGLADFEHFLSSAQITHPVGSL